MCACGCSLHKYARVGTCHSWERTITQTDIIPPPSMLVPWCSRCSHIAHLLLKSPSSMHMCAEWLTARQQAGGTCLISNLSSHELASCQLIAHHCKLAVVGSVSCPDKALVGGIGSHLHARSEFLLTRNCLPATCLLAKPPMDVHLASCTTTLAAHEGLEISPWWHASLLLVEGCLRDGVLLRCGTQRMQKMKCWSWSAARACTQPWGPLSDSFSPQAECTRKKILCFWSALHQSMHVLVPSCVFVFVPSTGRLGTFRHHLPLPVCMHVTLFIRHPLH